MGVAKSDKSRPRDDISDVFPDVLEIRVIDKVLAYGGVTGEMATYLLAKATEGRIKAWIKQHNQVLTASQTAALAPLHAYNTVAGDLMGPDGIAAAALRWGSLRQLFDALMEQERVSVLLERAERAAATSGSALRSLWAETVDERVEAEREAFLGPYLSNAYAQVGLDADTVAAGDMEMLAVRAGAWMKDCMEEERRPSLSKQALAGFLAARKAHVKAELEQRGLNFKALVGTYKRFAYKAVAIAESKAIDSAAGEGRLGGRFVSGTSRPTL